MEKLNEQARDALTNYIAADTWSEDLVDIIKANQDKYDEIDQTEQAPLEMKKPYLQGDLDYETKNNSDLITQAHASLNQYLNNGFNNSIYRITLDENLQKYNNK